MPTHGVRCKTVISGASALRAQKKSQLPSTRPLLPKRHNSLISRRWCELRGTWSNIQRKCGDNRKSVEAAVAKVDHIGRVLKSSMTALAVRIGAVRREQLLRREADAKAAVAGTGHDAAAVLRLLLRSWCWLDRRLLMWFPIGPGGTARRPRPAGRPAGAARRGWSAGRAVTP